MSPRLPSTDTSRSPGFKPLAAAGDSFSITPMRSVRVSGPMADQKTNSRMSATTTFTAGPAEITAMRFHTGWAW